jgi:hypothetical protein
VPPGNPFIGCFHVKPDPKASRITDYDQRPAMGHGEIWSVETYELRLAVIRITAQPALSCQSSRDLGLFPGRTRQEPLQRPRQHERRPRLPGDELAGSFSLGWREEALGSLAAALTSTTQTSTAAISQG